MAQHYTKGESDLPFAPNDKPLLDNKGNQSLHVFHLLFILVKLLSTAPPVAQFMSPR